ncbi:hypothetical protein MMC20_006195 [Loxospora ochrophaea]|nr:hypothetical protein [Loxospora ochrophaea]
MAQIPQVAIPTPIPVAPATTDFTPEEQTILGQKGVIEDLDRPDSGFTSLGDTQRLVWEHLDDASSKKFGLTTKSGERVDKIMMTAQTCNLVQDCLKNNSMELGHQGRHWAKGEFLLDKHDRVLWINNRAREEKKKDAGREITAEDTKLVLVREKFHRALVWAHGVTNHGGRDKTFNKLGEHYHGLKKELVNEWINVCPCRASKPNPVPRGGANSQTVGRETYSARREKKMAKREDYKEKQAAKRAAKAGNELASPPKRRGRKPTKKTGNSTVPVEEQLQDFLSSEQHLPSSNPPQQSSRPASFSSSGQQIDPVTGAAYPPLPPGYAFATDLTFADDNYGYGPQTTFSQQAADPQPTYFNGQPVTSTQPFSLPPPPADMGLDNSYPFLMAAETAAPSDFEAQETVLPAAAALVSHEETARLFPAPTEQDFPLAPVAAAAASQQEAAPLLPPPTEQEQEQYDFLAPFPEAENDLFSQWGFLDQGPIEPPTSFLNPAVLDTSSPPHNVDPRPTTDAAHPFASVGEVRKVASSPLTLLGDEDGDGDDVDDPIVDGGDGDGDFDIPMIYEEDPMITGFTGEEVNWDEWMGEDDKTM